MHLSFKIDQPADLIFSYLTDMQLFTSVHPVIYKIEPLGNDCYKVFETLKFGPLPVSFSYKAKVYSDSTKNKVNIIATVMRFTTIEMNFEIKEAERYCIVNEHINFKSFLPVKLIMKKIFKSQHLRLFDNINHLKIPALPLQY